MAICGACASMVSVTRLFWDCGPLATAAKIQRPSHDPGVAGDLDTAIRQNKEQDTDIRRVTAHFPRTSSLLSLFLEDG